MLRLAVAWRRRGFDEGEGPRSATLGVIGDVVGRDGGDRAGLIDAPHRNALHPRTGLETRTPPQDRDTPPTGRSAQCDLPVGSRSPSTSEAPRLATRPTAFGANGGELDALVLGRIAGPGPVSETVVVLFAEFDRPKMRSEPDPARANGVDSNHDDGACSGDGRDALTPPTHRTAIAEGGTAIAGLQGRASGPYRPRPGGRSHGDPRV